MIRTVVCGFFHAWRKMYWRNLLKRSPMLYIRRRYKSLFGEEINLDTPARFAEKIQWLKCNDRDQRIVQYADKYMVRKFIADTIGDEYLIPMIGSWDRAGELCYEDLPNAFVLKPNNSSGRVLICRDKSKLRKEDVFKIIEKWERENLTEITGEWMYERIPYKLICEEYLEDEIVDYKIYFAGGEFICTQVIAGRSSGEKQFGYFDEQWDLLDIKRKGIPQLSKPLVKPHEYETMLCIARKLAQDFAFIRVDLYNVNGRIYFGELSFYPNNGFVQYETDEMDDFFASRIKLPLKKSKV